MNPYTGLPYTPQLVRHGDFGRVVAEYWADGPRSTAPPGHWNEIANDVTDKMEALGIPKRIGGTGPVVSDLEWDVKKYFSLNGGMHDAAIAAWNHKGVYDSARPISYIRYMGQLGQSTDPNLKADIGGGVLVDTYNPNGLPLEPGLVEVITAATTAPGQRHEHLAGHEGKIAIHAWQGAIDGVAPFDDPSEISGVDWITAETWMPYQLKGFVTPPFAGYVSGHSTYSRTGAEVLTLFTGSEYFPGGIMEYDVAQGSGLDFEYGPIGAAEAAVCHLFRRVGSSVDLANLRRHSPAGGRLSLAAGSVTRSGRMRSARRRGILPVCRSRRAFCSELLAVAGIASGRGRRRRRD